jgi:predicted nucleic acid-binding Zn ribbon protein
MNASRNEPLLIYLLDTGMQPAIFCLAISTRIEEDEANCREQCTVVPE